MKRRNFLQTAATLSIPALFPITGARGAASRFTNLIAPDNDRILVIIHLFGGNDGLNTVIPIDQYDGLNAVRNNFAIRETEVKKITDTVGLHPEMGGMVDLYKDGQLNVIQSVGYPNQNRSHFRSTDIYTSGSAANVYDRTGWLGRYLDGQYPGFPVNYPNSGQPHPPAVSIGDTAHPTCEGPSINFSQSVLNPTQPIKLDPMLAETVGTDRYGRELDFIRTTMTQTNDYNDVIKQAADNGRNATSRYSEVYSQGKNRLLKQLQKVALMISGGLQSKVYTVYLSGFDLHANQVTPNTSGGEHANLLRQVSDAISVFNEDMQNQGLGEKVLGLTFSEFGRRIRPNASAGTDHGDAGPMFLFGSCVNGGVVGNNVQIHRDITQSAGVPMQFDFRDVYGSILVDWFDVPTTSVKGLLHENFKYMPLVNTCNDATDESTSTDEASNTSDGWYVGDPYPNPSSQEVSITIESPAPGNMRYSLFDGRGRLVLVNERMVNGREEVNLFARPSRLPAGTYILRIATEAGGSLTRKVVFD